MTQITDTSNFPLLAHEAGFDPIEERLRMNVRATIEAVFEGNHPVGTACPRLA
jgi:hypothetical protein